MSYSDAVSGKVAIVGIGAAFPDSENKERYWSLIKNGKDAIRGIPGTHWSVEDYYSADPKAPDMTYGRTGGFIRPFDFDPMEFGITPNSLEAIDTSHILGLVAAREALEDGGYGKGGRDFPRESTGVIIGITGAQELVIGLGARLGHPLWKKAVIDAGGDEELAADVSRRIAAGYPEWQELSFPGLLGNVAAGRIANFFDLGGTNCVIDAACASSLGAIDMAYMELVTGRADVMLTGGVDTFNDIFMFMCFSKTPAMSPEGHAKPFSANGDGTCIGEGVGILMLKRLEDARRDGDRVYAVIEGIGSGSDGRGAAVFAPQSKGQAKAIRRAYLSSGINPHTVDLIEAHGTGTKVGDGIELSSLVSVFSEFEGGEGHVCALGSVKGQIGHCKAAAGVAGVIKAALSLYYKELPPTLRCDPPLQPLTEDDCEFRVSSENRPWISDGSHPRRAGVSAFGFGGTNFHCVLEEASPEKTEIDWADAPEIAVLSSDSPDGLRKALAGFRGLSWSDFRRAAFESRKSFDPGAGCVLSIVESADGYDPASFEAKALKAVGEGASLPYSEGVFFSDFELKGATAFIFPGQGSQYPGMMRDSACLFPQLTSSLDLMERAFSAVHGKSLSEIIYPVARRALDSGFAQELTKTQHAQPALGAVALGNADVLGMFGVRADCAAGHSYGELAALCYSGMLARGDFAELSVLRGRLMGEGAGDRGSMCAVMAGYDALSEIIRAEGLDLTIANKNAPDQNVLSGGTEEILRAMKILDSRGITAKRLKVAAAFHSRFVSDAAAPFSDRISSVSFGKSSLPVYSNFTGKAYEEGSERLLLSSQLANPVLFSDEIEAMYNDGARLFIECGPRSGMCGLIKSILGGRGDFVALSADSSNGRRSSVLDMALLLARLASLGVHVDLSLWNPAPAPAEKPRFTVSVCGANYVRKREIPRSEKKYRDVSSSACPAPAASAAECVPSVERAGSQENTEAVRMIESMHARTAELHRQFLENQRMAFDSFRRMLGGSPSAALVGGSVDFPCTTPVWPSAKAAPDTGVGLPERTSPPSPEKRPVPPPAVPAPAPSAPALSSSAPAFDVFAAVAGVVAEKTGYPVEMLERGMDMESDLGVDSIKKVEIFSALRDAVPGMQAVGASEMGSIRTLGDAADAVSKGLPAPSAPAVSASSPAFDAFAAVAGVVAEKTGYPVEMLERSMDMESDLGVDSIKKVEIFSALKDAVPGMQAVGASEMGSIRTLGDAADAVSKGLPAPSAPAVSASSPAFDAFAAVAGVVAEKTGYPVEMLERSMDMESDLGVDSIKKVEIFSALKDAVPGMQAVGASEMGSIRTLGDAADAVSKGLPAPSAPAVSASSPAFDAFAAVAGVVAEKTGYPVEMLEHGMDMESDLGVDSIKKVEIFSALRDVVPGMRAVEASEMGSIRTLGDAARLIGGAPGAAVTVAEDASKTAGSSSEPSDGADLDRMILAMKPERLSSAPCFSGRIYVASPDASLAEFVGKGFKGLAEVVSGGMESIPEGVGGLVVVASATADELGFIEDAFRLERALLAAGGGLFATVSFMDGSFGLSGRAFERPVQGGLAGLAKTARQEYPSIRACAVDVDPLIASDPKTPGLVASAVLFGRSVEIGVGSSGLSGLEVERRKRSSGGAAVLPGKGDVVIVSGGGKGVTASCVIEFAESLPSGDKPCFALAGRTDLSHEEEPWLSGLELEKDVKKALMEHMESPSPAAIGRRCREIFTARAIRRTLAAVRAAGAGCEYVRADVCDPESVSALVKKARSLGRVSGFIHGAGVLADKLIADKTDPEFSRVFRTKAAGAMNVLSELSGDDLSLIVFFSSSTARFGRKGQVDYAAGNEVLNKIARREKALRPSCVVKAFNWGPWDGGMVNDGLKRLFASEGVGVIPLVEGGRFMASELASGDAEPEVVVIAGADGFDGVPSKDSGSGEKVVFEGRMSVADYPVLSDHVIGGMAVVPVALSAEIMAQAVLSANPGYYFAGYDDLRVESGIRLGGGESLDFVVVEGAGSASGGEILMPVSIRTVGAGGRMLRRVSCTMLLSSSRPSSRKPSGESGLPEGGGFPDPYGSLFHGSSLRGIESVTGISDKGIAVSVKKSPSPSEFMSSPLRSGWVTDFLASDCAFQMMILWTLKYKSAPSLPCYVRRMRRLAVPARGGMSVFARITGVSGNMVSADIVFSDSKGIEVAVIEGYECVCDPSLSGPFAENRLKA